MKYRPLSQANDLATPLSELMAQVFAEPDSEAVLDHFFSVFMDSKVGIVLIGAPPDLYKMVEVREFRDVSLAFTQAPDGRAMIAACADRPAFAERFDSSFNAELPGRELMEFALQLPEMCEGIMLYSALAEKSIGIARTDFEQLLAKSPRQIPPHMLH